MTIKRRKRLSLDSLYKFINRCRKEMKTCEKGKAYFASLILIGTSVEYIFTALIRVYPEMVYTNHKKLTDHWTLKELNEIVYKSGFMNRTAYLASERIRKYRNMVHPNWYAGRKPLRFSKKMVDERIADFNTIIDSVERNL